MGTTITWVAPYSFNQRLPFDIDYKVIGTFMEFYTALLRFVNFKLYKDIGLVYPPDKSLFIEDSAYLCS
jgi:pescadillo protein